MAANHCSKNPEPVGLWGCVEQVLQLALALAKMRRGGGTGDITILSALALDTQWKTADDVKL